MNAHVGIYCDAGNEMVQREEAMKTICNYCNTSGVDGLIGLIKNIFGPYLTDTNSKVRQAAIDMLVKCCESVLNKYLYSGKDDSEKLSKEKADFLIRFLIERIDDYDSVGGSLKGLLLFLQFENGMYIDAKLLLNVFNKINNKLNVPAMFQEWRQSALTMFEVAFTTSKYVNYIRSENKIDEFANGFKSSMWHEKDPRCLRIGFNAANSLLNHFADEENDDEKDDEEYCMHDETLEGIFDATSCYFPITFKPPPNDPYGIRPETLIQLLENIFASSMRMAKHVFPFFIEKMEADLTEAKVHSMNAWGKCMEKFNIHILGKYITPQLTTLIINEILRSNDDDTVPTALNFLKILVRTSMIATTSSSNNINSKKQPPSSKRQKTLVSPAWSNFINAVLKACVVELCGAPEALVGRAAARMLQAFAAASPTSFLVAMRRAVPPFLEFHSETSNESQKDAIIEAVALLTDIIDKEIAYFDGENEVKVVFDSMKELFWNSYQNSMSNDVQRKRVCLLALRNMIVRPPTSYIPLNEVTAMLTTLGNTILVKDEGNEEEEESNIVVVGDGDISNNSTNIDSITERTIMQVMIDVGQKSSEYTSFLIEQVVPKYVNNVRNILNDSLEDNDKIAVPLQVIANLCTIPEIFKYILPSLYNLCSNSMWFKKSSCIIFSCITRIILYGADTPACVEFCFSSSIGNDDNGFSFVQVLLNDYFNFNEMQGTINMKCKYNIESCYQQIFTALTQNIPDVKHDEFVNDILTRYMSKKLSVKILVAIIGSCKRSVLTSTAVGVPLLAQNLLDICLSENNTFENSIRPAAKCLASLLNKVNKEHDKTVETCTNVLIDALNQTDNTFHIYTLSWFTKALVMRGHSSASKLIQLLFESLKSKNQGVANMAARSFSLIMEDSKDVLNRKCNVNCTLFYKQRFFEQVLPKLKTMSESKKEKYRANVIKAMMFLAKHMTTSALLSHADTILPMVIEAISSDDIEACITSLTACSIVIKENLDLMEKYVDTIIPRIILLTKQDINRNIAYRILALDILLEMLRLPYLRIHKFKFNVLKALGDSIDDGARSVRRKAVQVRNEWFVANGDNQF